MTRRARAIAGAFLLLPHFSIGATGGPNAADAQRIDACLKAAGQQGASGVACIGIVADPCIAAVREKDSASKDAVACATRELAIWTTRLQNAARLASKGGGKAIATAMAASRKSWSDSLTRLCPLFDNLDPGMSLGGANYCHLQETAMRALMLERLADAVNPH